MIILTQPLFGQRNNTLSFGLAYDLPAIYAPKYFDGVIKSTQWPGIGGRCWFEYNRKRLYFKAGYVFQKLDVIWLYRNLNNPLKSKTAHIVQFHTPLWLGYRVVNKATYQIGLAGMLGLFNWQSGIYSVYYRNGELLQGPSTIPYRHVWGINMDYNHTINQHFDIACSVHFKNIYQNNPNKYFQETDYFQVNNSYIGISLGIQYRIK